MDKLKKNFWALFFTVTPISFVLLYLGMYYLFGSRLTVTNMAALLILSNIFGIISSTLYILKLKIMCSTFTLGIAIGFLDMFRVFIFVKNGWEDLTGMIFLITWAAIGLCIGAAGQFFKYLFQTICSHIKNK